MDAVIADNLPQMWQFYQEYLAPLQPYIAPLHASFLHWESLFYRFVYPSLYPVYRLTSYFVRRTLASAVNTATGNHSSTTSGSRSSSSSSSSPSSLFGNSGSAPLFDFLVSVLSSAILLWVSLRALSFVRRQVMWWIGVVTTLATWGGLLLLGLYVYANGVEKSVDGAAWLLGLLLGWVQQGNAQGSKLASEKQWDAERYRRAGAGGGAAGYGGGRGRAY